VRFVLNNEMKFLEIAGLRDLGRDPDPLQTSACCC
jgi:hypothetical protein